MSTETNPGDVEIVGSRVLAPVNDDFYLRTYALSGADVKASAAGVRALLWGSPLKSKRAAACLVFGLCLGTTLVALKMGGSGMQPTAAQVTQAVAESHNAAVLPVPVVHPSAHEVPAITPKLRDVTASQTPGEVTKLRARNRRLEALVEVLRQRKIDSKTANQEQSTILGQ